MRTRRYSASKGFGAILISTALLAAMASPAAATVGYWYPAPDPLPATFWCGATSEAPPRVFHQTCLHFSNGHVQGAFIVNNRTGTSMYINSARIDLTRRWVESTAWSRLRRNTCYPSWIGNLVRSVCYGDYTPLFTGYYYRAEAGLQVNNGPWSFLDYSRTYYVPDAG